VAYKLKILSDAVLPDYKKALKVDLEKSLKKLKPNPLPFKLDFYEASASTYSSNIEGNSTSLDSFFKYVSSKALKQTKEIKEIKDLIKAYQFAKINALNKKNFFNSHKILSKEFLITSARGKFRKGNVVIGGSSGIVYVAIELEKLKNEFDLFFSDVEILLNSKLKIEEVFYFASMIHLIFEKIHPFNDGNGRAGRLLEKWFLAHFIPEKAWMIESEKYYFENRPRYYSNLSIGFDYEACDINKSLPFLLMLPNSLK
jgi:Fic family protein